MIEAYNTGSVAIAAGGIAPLAAANKFCDKRNVTLNGSSLTINKTGTYEVSADFVFAPTDTEATVQMYVDGSPVEQSLRTETTTAAANTALHTQGIIRMTCCRAVGSKNITFVYANAGTQVMADVIVKRID